MQLSVLIRTRSRCVVPPLRAHFVFYPLFVFPRSCRQRFGFEFGSRSRIWFCELRDWDMSIQPSLVEL